MHAILDSGNFLNSIQICFYLLWEITNCFFMYKRYLSPLWLTKSEYITLLANNLVYQPVNFICITCKCISISHFLTHMLYTKISKYRGM